MDNSTRFRVRTSRFGAILVFSCTVAHGAQQTVETRDGLASYRLATTVGAITLYLTADIRADDTISGTVEITPTGRDEAERQQNLEALRGYAVAIQGVPLNLRGKTFTYLVPSTASNSVLSLRDSEGDNVSQTTIPIGPRGLQLDRSVSPRLPRLGQAGRPVQIIGSFDGDASNTSVTLSNNAMDGLAESPRLTVVRSPSQPIGLTEIVLGEGGTQVKGEFRNVRVLITAPKIFLNPGETTVASIQVFGLAHLRTALPLRLIGTGPIQMEGGNLQVISIQPGEVAAQGVYQITRQIHATEVGTFSVSGSVLEAD